MAKKQPTVAEPVHEIPAEGGSYIRQPETGTLELQARTQAVASLWPVDDSHLADFIKSENLNA